MDSTEINLQKFVKKVFPEGPESKLTEDLVSEIKDCLAPGLLEYVRWAIHSVLDSKKIDEIVSGLEEKGYVWVIDAEKLGVKWKILKIRIPGSSTWIEFNVFISNDTLTAEDFESNEEYKKSSYSRSDVSKLLYLINKWLNENWLISDNLERISYSSDNYDGVRRMAPYFLSKISCHEWKPLIDGHYFLYYRKDKDKEWYSTVFYCDSFGNSTERPIWRNFYEEDWHLFLKI